MISSKTFEKRINRDFDRAKRDLALLRDDLVTGLNKTFEQLADGPKKSTAVAVKSLNKSLGQGLNQYNTRVQDVVDKVPGEIGKKVSRYPWVAITMSVVLGLMLGVVLRLGRHAGN